MFNPHTTQPCVKLMEVAIIIKNTYASIRHMKCCPTSICTEKSQDNVVSDIDGKPKQNRVMEIMRYNEIQMLKMTSLLPRKIIYNKQDS